MDKPLKNARPLNLQQWSKRPEVDALVDAILKECRILGKILRERNQRICLKVVLLNLYACYKSDPTRYVRYPRSHRTWQRRYNVFGLSPDQLRAVADWLIQLEYVEPWKGKWSRDKEKSHQSRMRAAQNLVDRFEAFQISPLMVVLHDEAETIILKDAKKNRVSYEDTDDTRRMREEIKIVNDLQAKTLINLYMSDAELEKLNVRMRSGKIYDPNHNPEFEDEDDEGIDEEPRGAVDFTQKLLRRVFNRTFNQGGRVYGPFYQSLPREVRRYIRINHMNTVEEDFSAIHINLIYWRAGLPVPEGDLYGLDGFPQETREVVKKCLLTVINVTSKKKAIVSIQNRVNGYYYVTKNVNGEKEIKKKIIPKKDRIKLPPGVTVEEIIDAFEKKHEAISGWFFKGRGRELQYWDSIVALKILLKLAKEGVPCLPLHDSFIVAHPQARGLREAMREAFFEVTGRYPKIDAKTSLMVENELRGEEEMEQHYRWKIDGNGRFSEEFRREYSTYVKSIEEWKRITGKSNIFVYSKSKRLNRETYE